MKYMDKLLELGCFSFDDALAITGNHSTAASFLSYYEKRGAIVQVRKGLYSAINPVDKEPVANKFLIGSKLTDTAVISHHSAFDYHGYANQVSYQVLVSSMNKFNSFEFAGYTYIRCPNKFNFGVEQANSGERVTDIERTVLDSLNDMEKDMGFEEVIQCISAIPVLTEKKLISYLEKYNKCFLYQKVGFVFEHFNDNFNFSEDFFSTCQSHTGNSSRYLLKDMKYSNLCFSKKWHLTYPENLWSNLLGGDMNADI